MPALHIGREFNVWPGAVKNHTLALEHHVTQDLDILASIDLQASRTQPVTRCLVIDEGSESLP